MSDKTMTEKIRRYNEAYWTRKAEKGGNSDAKIASTE